MPSIIGKKTGRRSSRHPNPRANRPQPTAPINIVSVTKNNLTMAITFDQPIAIKGVPQYGTDLVGPVPQTAGLSAPNVLQLTFTSSVAAALQLVVPYEEPAIRNLSGGFVYGQIVALAA